MSKMLKKSEIKRFHRMFKSAYLISNGTSSYPDQCIPPLIDLNRAFWSKLMKYKTFLRIFGKSLNLITSRIFKGPITSHFENHLQLKKIKLNNFIRMMPNSHVELTTFLHFEKFRIEKLKFRSDFIIHVFETASTNYWQFIFCQNFAGHQTLIRNSHLEYYQTKLTINGIYFTLNYHKMEQTFETLD